MTAFYMTTANRELKREPSDLERERGRRYAAWLRAAMRSKGWNKARLAAASGVSATYLGILENDGVEKSTGEMRRASEKVVTKIADALGADVDAAMRAAGFVSSADAVREAVAIYNQGGVTVSVTLADTSPFTPDESRRLARAVAGVVDLVRADRPSNGGNAAE